ncbi:MAG TPA: class I SAM-dependent methyltransferase [Vicinamibacteria bacterium]|nr:class I SAM-dependent methyltransferase [Vicinamibacteria bacterium]
MVPLLEPELGYALWAENYPPRAHNELMRVEESVMKSLWKGLRAVRALDVGTGTGRNLGLLDGARETVGVDRSTAMLKRALASARVVCGDAEALPFETESFDLVVASLMAGDLRELSPFTNEAARVLRTGGSLVYSDFHPSWGERRWQRTFETADGRKWRIPYHSHGIDDHRAALRSANLDALAVEEPVLGGSPVLVVIRAVKR